MPDTSVHCQMNHGRRMYRIWRLSQVALAVLASVFLWGCQDWPDERSTALEMQNILSDLGKIETASDPNVPWPAHYNSPPQKIRQTVGGVSEWRLT